MRVQTHDHEDITQAEKANEADSHTGKGEQNVVEKPLFRGFRWTTTRMPVRRGREMIDLLAVEEPKPKPAKIRAVSYEAAIDQLFKRMRSSSSALT